MFRKLYSKHKNSFTSGYWADPISSECAAVSWARTTGGMATTRPPTPLRFVKVRNLNIVTLHVEEASLMLFLQTGRANVNNWISKLDVNTATQKESSSGC